MVYHTKRHNKNVSQIVLPVDVRRCKLQTVQNLSAVRKRILIVPSLPLSPVLMGVVLAISLGCESAGWGVSLLGGL
jgi:hypothetical protein